MDEATNQDKKVISTPMSAAIAAPVGLAAMAVNQTVEEMLNPAMLFIIR